MPVMDGYQSSKNILKMFGELSQKDEYSHLVKPIIFAMTAVQIESVVAECVKVGMNGILYKPVNKKGIMAQVEKFFK